LPKYPSEVSYNIALRTRSCSSPTSSG
jgi:hypothetical protein